MGHRITKEFLEIQLNDKISSFNTSKATKEGDGYTCELYSVEVEFENKDRKKEFLIVKLIPENIGIGADFLLKSNGFYKEVFIYDEWTKELIQMQKNMGRKPENIILPNNPPFIAGRAVDTSKKGQSSISNEGNLISQNFLIMQDVRKALGYEMSKSSKFESQDFNHMKFILEEIAVQHSLSWIYKSKNKLKNLVEKYPIFRENLLIEEGQDFFIKNGLKNMKLFKDFVASAYTENSDIYKSINEKFSKSKNILSEAYCFVGLENGINEEEVENLLRIKPENSKEFYELEPWLVLNHSDAWVNNTLFKYNSEGVPEEMIILDFQFCSEACLTVDLAFIFYMNTDLEFRERHMEELLRIYHQKFISVCEELEESPPQKFTDFDIFLKKFHNRKYFGYITALLWLPFIFYGAEEDYEEEDVGDSKEKEVEQDEYIRVLKKSKTLKKFFLDLAKEMYNAGII